MTEDERTLSIEKFRELEGLTEDQFSALVWAKAAPRIFVIRTDDADVERITPEARAQWHSELRYHYKHGQNEDDMYLTSVWDRRKSSDKADDQAP